jgi:hypothetical protein
MQIPQSRVGDFPGRDKVALALYILLMVASLLPQSLHPLDTLAYVGDPLETAYALAWNVRQLPHGPAALVDAQVLHPNPRAWLLAPHRLLSAMVAAPFLWATGNAILAVNAALAVALLVAAMAGRHLARRLGLPPLAAWSAGALYAFNTYQISETARVQVIFHGFTPLALAELIDLWRSGRARHAWRLGGLVLLLALADNYNVLYGLFLLALVASALAVARPRALGRTAAALAGPALVALLAFAPLALAYFRAARVYGFEREPPRGIDVQHYFTTPPGNLIYGQMGAPHRLQQRGPHFVGFVTLGLVLLAAGAWATRRTPADEDPAAPGRLLPDRVWVPAAAALALLLVALSLGREISVWGTEVMPGPYRLLHALPGFRFIRIPERLGFTAMLFVALLAARGLALLLARGWPRVALAAAALASLEHVSVLTGTVRLPVGRARPAVYEWLARSDARAVAEVPVHGENLVRKESIEQYFLTLHWKPIIHGYVSYQPLLGTLLRKAAATFPSEGSLQALQRVGVDTVVLHHGREGAAAMAGPVEELAAAGRLLRLARFSGPAARSYEGTGEDVLRVLPAPPLPAAPQPGGRRMVDPAWRYSAKEGDPALAIDGDPDTGWTVAHALDGDEIFEVAFGRPLKVSGLALPLDRRSAFPLPFRVAGLARKGWIEVARFDDAHLMQVIDQLRRDPGRARLGFDLGGRELRGLRLLAADEAPSFDGWWLAEVEVLVP